MLAVERANESLVGNRPGLLLAASLVANCHIY
jgi:hypothetical protein